MSQARGRKGQLVIDFESSFGVTPGTPNGIRLPMNSSKIVSKQNMIESNTIRNNRNPIAPSLGNVDVSGTVVVPMDVTAIGYWLKAIFGPPVTTGTGPYVHTFKPGDTQPSLVMEQGFTDISVFELFNGCKVNKFSLTLGGGNELTASIDIIGAKEAIGSVSFDATPVDNDLKRFNDFQGTVKEGGAAIAILTQMVLDIQCNLDNSLYCIGSNGMRGDIPEGLLQVSGSITAMFQDSVLLNKAISGTESSLEMTFTNGADILKITMPELIYERNSPGIEGPKGVLINLPFRAYYDNSVEQAAIIAVLTNTKNSYA
jgi:hypothetical protein